MADTVEAANGQPRETVSLAGAVYAPWIASLLDYELATRKPSLEQRGIAVISTCGTLVTLLFALVGAVTAATGFTLPNASRYWLAVALGAFVIAAVVAMWSNVPQKYGDIEVAENALAGMWDETSSTAQLEIATNQLKQVIHARGLNTRKAHILFAAVCAEIVAVVLLSVAIAAILFSAPPKPAASTSLAPAAAALSNPTHVR